MARTPSQTTYLDAIYGILGDQALSRDEIISRVLEQRTTLFPSKDRETVERGLNTALRNQKQSKKPRITKGGPTQGKGGSRDIVWVRVSVNPNEGVDGYVEDRASTLDGTINPVAAYEQAAERTSATSITGWRGINDLPMAFTAQNPPEPAPTIVTSGQDPHSGALAPASQTTQTVPDTGLYEQIVVASTDASCAPASTEASELGHRVLELRKLNCGLRDMKADVTGICKQGERLQKEKEELLARQTQLNHDLQTTNQRREDMERKVNELEDRVKSETQELLG